ncbi:MAG: ABC transporter substrate-binding protein [Bauldia sp.]|nr:ABC transporter substrate-binding protein [Bauldia sp.]
MSISRREVLVGSLTAAGIAALPGRLWAAEGDVVRGGTLFVANSVEPVHLVGAFTTQAGPPTAKLFDGLVDIDLEGNATPALAESWEVSPDGLGYTFRLRRDVVWHDGEPFTADDVEFSLSVWKQYHARGRATFANVTATEIPDDHTIVFKLSQPTEFILAGLIAHESPVLARHTYPAEGDLAIAPRNNEPIGTGPFRFVEWERGSHIALERNAQYWDKDKPYVDQLIIRTLPDPATNSAALEADSIHASNFIPLSNVGRLAQNAELQVIDDPRGSRYSVGAVVLEFNLDRERFHDRRLREAFAHAIDRDFIQQNLYFGYATPTETPVPPGLPEWHNPNVPTYPFDPARAEAILEEAGYRRGSDGVRLRLFNDYAANNATHLQVAQYIRSVLAGIGVELEIRNQDFGQFVNRVYTQRDFDTAIYHATVGPDPAIGAQRFYWSKNFQPGVAFSNAANYNNPEVDALLEQAAVTADRAERKALYDRFQTIVQTDIVRIPIISPRYPIVVRANVRDYISSSAGASGSNASTYLVDA